MEATTDIPTTEDTDTGGREMLRKMKPDLLQRPRLILNTCSMDIITPPLTLIPWLTAITTPTPPLILPQSLILLLLLLLNPSPTTLTQEVPSMPSLNVKPRLRPNPNLGTTVTMVIPTDTTAMEVIMEATTDIPTDTGGNKRKLQLLRCDLDNCHPTTTCKRNLNCQQMKNVFKLQILFETTCSMPFLKHYFFKNSQPPLFGTRNMFYCYVYFVLIRPI